MKNPRDSRSGAQQPRDREVIALFESARVEHKAGRLAGAEARYREVLQAVPDHADALHLLGMIAFQVGRFDVAAQLIERGLAVNPYHAERHYDLGTALQRLGRAADAAASFRRTLALDANYADAYFNLATILEADGLLDEAASAYRNALARNPADVGAQNNLANILQVQGKRDDALARLSEAVRRAPQDANLRYNLANLLKDMRRFDDAVSRYRETIVLAPRHRPAFENLAAVLHYLGRNGEAVACREVLVALDPRDAAAHTTLGDLLTELGRDDAALDSYLKALAITANPRTKASVARAVASVTPTRFDAPLHDLMVDAIAEPWARPSDLMLFCCQLIGLAPGIAACIDRAAAQWPVAQPTLQWFGAEALAALDTDALLRAALRSAPVCELKLERLLTILRAAMLDAAMAISEESQAAAATAQPPLLALYCSVAEQCFINEYVFFATADETARARSLAGRLAAVLESAAPVPVLWVAAVAAYQPLASSPGSARLRGADWPAPVARLIQQQLDEPREEAACAAAIARLTPIGDGVSREVRQQYEQNPYPRWIKAAPAPVAEPLAIYVGRRLPAAAPKNAAGADAGTATRPGTVEVLVAGCGTGQEPIELARAIDGARVLAVDMSVASLAYAQRKTHELALTNIEYAQADILQLGGLGRSFDLIQSYGVLHHLAEPAAGLRILASLLRPGGRMALGLYSEHARASVVAARAFIAARGYDGAPSGIRHARQDLLATPALASLATFRDFFTTSECRDLLFHVQEHRFTLPQVQAMLDTAGLRLTGLVASPLVRRAYAERFADDPAQVDVGHWDAFERAFPLTFVGMYGLWAERPRDA